MALINCPHCSEQISEHARKCPKCGEKLQTRKLTKSSIQCPECGSEIANGSKPCPKCGYQSSNNKGFFVLKIVVIIMLLILAGCCVVYFVGVNKTKTQIKNVNEMIKSLEENGIPSQEDYNRTVEAYNSISDKNREQVKNTNVLDKYKDVDLNKVNNINDKISNLTDDVQFSKVIAIEDEYNALSSSEKDLIDISPLASFKKLSNVENAALAVAKNVQSVMKSKSDFKVNAIYVKDDLKKMNFYWVKIEYTGTNSFGASLDKTSFFPMSKDFKDPFFGLAAITGMNDYLDNVSNYTQYEDCKEKENKIDADKITYYLNN